MMYELWARRRPIEGRGYPYEFICRFNNEVQFYYMCDQLDRNVYQECMIIKDNRCVFSREFEKPMVYRKVKK